MITSLTNIISLLLSLAISVNTTLNPPETNIQESEYTNKCTVTCDQHPYDPSKYPDILENAWYYDDVTACLELNLINYKSDGQFHPEDFITDVEFLNMLLKAIYPDELNQTRQPENQPWYYASILCYNNLLLNHDNFEFENKIINRGDAAQLLFDIIKNHGKNLTGTDELYKTTLQNLNNKKAIPTNRIFAVINVYALNIITSTNLNYFNHMANITRAQACTITMRMLNLIKGNPDDLYNIAYHESNKTKTLANGMPITTENVKAILNQLQIQYPTGTPWTDPSVNPDTKFYFNAPLSFDNNHDVHNLVKNYQFQGIATGTGGNNIGELSLTYGCGGWACLISEYIFGSSGFPARQVYNLQDIRPGDIVLKYNPETGYIEHINIIADIIQTDDKYLYATCDGNITWAVIWNNEKSIELWNDSLQISQNGIDYDVLVFTRYPE